MRLKGNRDILYVLEETIGGEHTESLPFGARSRCSRNKHLRSKLQGNISIFDLMLVSEKTSEIAIAMLPIASGGKLEVTGRRP